MISFASKPSTLLEGKLFVFQVPHTLSVVSFRRIVKLLLLVTFGRIVKLLQLVSFGRIVKLLLPLQVIACWHGLSLNQKDC